MIRRIPYGKNTNCPLNIGYVAKPILAFAGIATLLLAFAPRVYAAVPEQGKTLANLQAAYNGESNAHAKYLLFAEKASEEGYGEVASLFRAIARAEEVHLNNHAAVIRSMGGEPTADIKTAEVKSTLENLQESANLGEAYERDTMYPEFIQQAELESNNDAVRTFNFALTAEGEHYKLLTAAAENLENMKGDSRTYYVCSVCGYTAIDLPAENCVSCMSPKDKYEAIS